MYLARLIYTSTKSDEFAPDDIAMILNEAKNENIKNNVTGILYFNRNYFLQCLEGSRDDINATYQRIIKDPRHKHPVLLQYKEITHREFDSWSMGYVPETSATDPINLKFSSSKNFTPYEMSGESAFQLLMTLKESVSSHQ